MSSAPMQTSTASVAPTVADPVSQQQDSTAEHQDSHQSEPLSSPVTKSEARRQAKVKAEVVQLKLELAKARLALIELQSSDEEEFASDTELPIFNGNHRCWLKFHDAYYKTAKHLTAAKNRSRLRLSLIGKAKEAVKGLLMVSADPDSVMEALQLRFYTPDSIAKEECERLRKLPILTESPHQLITFATEVENVVKTLEDLKPNKYIYDPPLIRSLVEKLTPTLRSQWYDLGNVSFKNLLLFSCFLKIQAQKCSSYAEPANVNVKSYVKGRRPLIKSGRKKPYTPKK